jgi:hypothetical protein
MKIDRDYKVGIITSIIASAVFLYFLEPILRFFGRLVFGFFHSFFSAYLDRLFLKAALGVPPDPSLFVLGIALGSLVGFFTLSTFALMRMSKDKGESDEQLKSKPRRFKRLRVGSMVSIILLFAVSFHVYWSMWFQFKLTTSFSQHMRCVAPYVSEQQEKVLQSRWAQMKNQKDYEDIYSDLKNIAATNKIVLPENVVYSFNDF